MARAQVQSPVQEKHLQQMTSQLRRPLQILTSSPITQPHQTPQGYEAKPITPPQSAEIRGSYRCIVDYDHQPFCITWWGSPEYPDLTRFPLLKNVDVSSVQQTSEMALLWRDSTMIDCGAHASIRITEHGRFPILKLAHLDELSIKLIQHELDVLADLTKLGLPVVEFDQQPIWDNGFICGYRMKSSPNSNHLGFVRE